MNQINDEMKSKIKQLLQCNENMNHDIKVQQQDIQYYKKQYQDVKQSSEQKIMLMQEEHQNEIILFLVV